MSGIVFNFVVSDISSMAGGYSEEEIVAIFED